MEPSDRTAEAGAENVASLRRSHEALQELYLVTAEPGLDEDERIERMLDIGRRRLGVASAHLSVIDRPTDTYEVELAVGEGMEPGLTAPFSTTYCHETVEHDEPQLFPDLENSVWEGTPTQATHGLSCYVGGRVDVDDELYGTVCFSGTEPREPFTEDERTLVQLLVEWIGQRLQQRALEETVEDQQAAIETADSAITIAEHDPEGGRPLVYVNRGFEELTGYGRETVLGRDCRFLQGPETDPAKSAEIGRTLDAGERVETVIRNHRADGTPFWNELEVTPIREDGEVVRYVGTQRDVTERIEQRQAVEALLERTRTLLDAETTTAVAEAAAAAVEDVLGHDCVVRLRDPDSGHLLPVAGDISDREGMAPLAPGESLAGQAFERGETVELDDVATAAGGYGDTADPSDGLAVPLGEHGTIAIALTEGELTEFDRRIAEILGETVRAALDRAAQRDRLQLYETAIEDGSEMTAVVGADGRVELVSDSLATFLGSDREALVGRQVDGLLPEGQVARLGEVVEGITPGETREFETVLTVDGESRPVELEVSRGGGPEPLLVAVVRDITELAETRGALSDQRDRFSSLFAHIPDPAVETTLEGDEAVIRRCNEAFAAVFGGGRPVEALRGLRYRDVVALVDDSDRSRRANLRARLRNGEAVREELRRRTDRGVRDFIFRGAPYDADGERRAFGIYTDITEQKRRQRRVEVLNRVLRHNVRNQLSVVEGHANLLAETADTDRERQAADGLLRATGDLLSVSETAREAQRALSESRPDGTSATAVVRDVVTAARAAWPDRTVEFEPPTAPVSVERAERLEPVVSNLVENALEYTDGPVVVRMEPADGRLELRVTDHGPGVPELERSLVGGDREITQLDHGNGIGLWAVRWIVDAMAGEVRFEDGADRHAVVVSVPLAGR